MSQTFHDHFSGVANRYADFRPHYPAELFDYLARLVPRDSLVWDCACGNGQATYDLARHFDRVVATDASREQIAAATALSTSLSRAWGDANSPRLIVWPLSLRVGRK